MRGYSTGTFDVDLEHCPCPNCGGELDEERIVKSATSNIRMGIPQPDSGAADV